MLFFHDDLTVPQITCVCSKGDLPAPPLQALTFAGAWLRAKSEAPSVLQAANDYRVGSIPGRFRTTTYSSSDRRMLPNCEV